MSKRVGVFLFVFTFLCVVAFGFAKTGRDEEQPGIARVSIRDFCDPPTFNAVLGNGACVGTGRQQFAQFNAELREEKSVGAWRFNPTEILAEEGVNLVLVNRGGETHTFTRVAEFGGGFVAALNGPSGTPIPRPECARVLPGGGLAPQPPSPNNIFIAAGQTVQGPSISEDEENVKFQCCIHPWMRTVVNPEERDHGRSREHKADRDN